MQQEHLSETYDIGACSHAITQLIIDLHPFGRVRSPTATRMTKHLKICTGLLQPVEQGLLNSGGL